MPMNLAEEAVKTLGLLCDVTKPSEFLERLHPDVVWKIPGAWPGISGSKHFEDIERFMVKVFPAGFPDGIVADIHHVHIDRDTVFIEFTGRAATSKGRVYENSYCFVFAYEGDRVIEIREYMDTMYADRILHQ